MATPAMIEAQVKLEREQIREGLKKLHENTRKLEEKTYASASVYGAASIKALLPYIVKRIDHTKDRITQRKNGAHFKEINEYLFQLESLATAAIALKITFDKVFGHKETSNFAVNICDSIGQAVEQECQLRYYEKTAPGLFHVIKENYWHASCGTQQRATTMRTMLNRYDIEPWKGWGRANRIKLGGWLLDCICTSQDPAWFEKLVKHRGSKKELVVVPTNHLMQIKDQLMETAELFSPIAYPMLIEPNDWSAEKQGGYLLNEVMRGHEMVRRGKPTCIQGENAYAFLNHIQKVAYKLNPFIVEVAETLEEKQISVGKFKPVVSHELPPKPFDIDINKDSRKDYRRRAAEAMNLNAQEFKRSCRTRMTMAAVRRFKDVPEFFIPWSFDYRGRAYPIPAFLTPQCTDFGKSLLRFAEESYMTFEAEDWIAFQVATTYGLDKATMQERVKWTRNNHELISRVADDPIGNVSEWESADEPWQFLAACDEYYHCIIKCDRQWTGLPVATDATCSGLQILAGLARDKSTAELVNVLPSERPQDAYKVVAQAAMPSCPAHLQQHMDRKVVKRVVMTVPYNAKPHSNRKYIREALNEKNVTTTPEELTQIVKAVRSAMDDVVPGPMAVMSWIEKEVSAAIVRGDTELSWKTPSGFIVNQKLMKPKDKPTIIELQLLGRCKLSAITEETEMVVDKRHHCNATAPNLIHSLDASLLHLSALRFEAPIALIHDSVLCRATDMSTLSTVVRETYMHLFAEHDYLQDFANQIGAESKPPIIGDLQPQDVLHSTYFFC